MRVTPFPEGLALAVERWDGDAETLVVLNFGDRPVELCAKIRAGVWVQELDSADAAWGGPGAAAPAELVADGAAQLALAPHSVAVYALRVEPVTHR